MSSNSEGKKQDRATFRTFSKLQAAIQKGVALYIRVSTDFQAKHNDGSINFQREQVKLLEAHGVQPEQVDVYEDDLGKTASKGVGDRKGFARLVGNIEAGSIGLVVVAFLDRAQRTFDAETQRIYDALEEQGGLVMIGGSYYDPSVPGDRAMLEMLTVMSKFANRQGAIRALSARLSKARRLSAHIPTPTGLIWANAEDPAYKTALDADLHHRIAPESLARHRTQRKRSGESYHILPDPRPGVFRAAELAVRWFLETGSIADVIERILNDPEWPEGQAGHFPMTQESIFNPETVVEWVPLRDRPDGRDDLSYGVIYQWLSSPVLYGIYSMKSKAMRKLSKEAAKLGTSVWEVDAFPGLAASTDYERVKKLLHSPSRRFGSGSSFNGVKNHLIPYLYCGHTLRNGEVCGRRYNPLFSSSAGRLVGYESIDCGSRGHWSSTAVLDPTVEEIVLAAFTPRLIREELAKIEKDIESSDVLLSKSRRDVKKLEGTASFQAAAAENAKNPNVADAWLTRHAKTVELWDRRCKELRQLEITSERRNSLANSDADRILELAGDLPMLIKKAKDLNGALKDLMIHLVDRVWVRRLGAFSYEVRVVFPSGFEERGIHFSARVPSSQALRVVAHQELLTWLRQISNGGPDRPGGYAGELAERLNSFWKPQYHGQPGWDVERICALALWHEYKDPPPAYRDQGIAIDDLARQVGEAQDAVFAALCYGELGDAWTSEGAIFVAPSPDQLHSAFPDFALREVAETIGASPESVGRIADLQNEFGKSNIRDTAEYHNATFRDAAGRVYTYRWVCSPEQIEAELQRRLSELPPPQGETVQGGHWMSARQVTEEFGTSSYLLKQHGVHTCNPGFGPVGKNSVYYWMTPELGRRLWGKSIDEAVTRWAPSTRAVDYLPRSDVEEILASLGITNSGRALRAALVSGRLTYLRALSPTGRQTRNWILYPQEFRKSREQAITWLTGAAD